MTAIRKDGWPDERVDALRRLVGEGALSLSAMGRELGVSGGAVAMKIRRLGLAWDRPARIATERKARSVVETLPPIVRADGSLVTLANVREGECRFPCGDQRGGDLILCGRKTKAGATYCEAHRRLAFKPSKPKEGAS